MMLFTEWLTYSSDSFKLTSVGFNSSFITTWTTSSDSKWVLDSITSSVSFKFLPVSSITICEDSISLSWSSIEEMTSWLTSSTNSSIKEVTSSLTCSLAGSSTEDITLPSSFSMVDVNPSSSFSIVDVNASSSFFIGDLTSWVASSITSSFTCSTIIVCSLSNFITFLSLNVSFPITFVWISVSITSVIETFWLIGLIEESLLTLATVFLLSSDDLSLCRLSASEYFFWIFLLVFSKIESL